MTVQLSTRYAWVVQWKGDDMQLLKQQPCKTSSKTSHFKGTMATKESSSTSRTATTQPPPAGEEARGVGRQCGNKTGFCVSVFCPQDNLGVFWSNYKWTLRDQMDCLVYEMSKNREENSCKFLRAHSDAQIFLLSKTWFKGIQSQLLILTCLHLINTCVQSGTLSVQKQTTF